VSCPDRPIAEELNAVSYRPRPRPGALNNEGNANNDLFSANEIRTAPTNIVALKRDASLSARIKGSHSDAGQFQNCADCGNIADCESLIDIPQIRLQTSQSLPEFGYLGKMKALPVCVK